MRKMFQGAGHTEGDLGLVVWSWREDNGSYSIDEYSCQIKIAMLQ